MNKKTNNQQLIIIASLVIVFILAIVLLIVLLTNGSKPNVTPPGSTLSEEQLEQQKQSLIAVADSYAVTYDYDTAIATLQTWEGYEEDEAIVNKIAEYQTIKQDCVKIDPSKVTHVFYHSLVVDPERSFVPTKDGLGNYKWMTTIKEFNAITQEMYDRGYVLVSLHDLYEMTTDEDGNTVIKKGSIYLPKGKKAYVLSLDDLSYYHSYDGYGFASKLCVDKNGKLYNEYIDENGKVKKGAYDCVPLLEEFIAKHPDACYKGARGTIALTGYNGIFGYRTDESYSLDTPDLNKDKRDFLLANPDFDVEKERKEAKKVADALKKAGWDFASHTWGHLNVNGKSLASLKADNERWKKNVESIVGKTNVIIFAHGADIGGWGKYQETNEVFQYFKSEGYNIFCNVDGSTPYLTYFGTDYMRQGRRNLDGIRMYYNITGKQNNLSDLFDAEKIIDPDRPDYSTFPQ